MNSLFLNFHRIGNENTQRAFRHLCLLHRPIFVSLAESFMDFEMVSSSFWFCLRLSWVGVNSKSSGLSIIWLLASGLILAVHCGWGRSTFNG